MGRMAASFSKMAREEPLIGEPMTVIFLTRSGYLIATDRLTVPPHAVPHQGRLGDPQAVHELVDQV